MTILHSFSATLRHVVVLAGLSLCLFPLTGAHAAYPDRPVRLLVPYGPGGTTDLIARQFADQLSRRLGQPVVIENRPGAATNIAAQALANAEPNGYTLMLVTNQLTINSVFGPVPAMDPIDGFAPVRMVAEIPFAVGVDAKSPLKSAADLVVAGRAKESTISHAQFEPQMRLLSSALGIPLLGVPYQGGAQALTAVLSGEVAGMLSAVPAMSAQVKAGKMRLIGVTSARRIAGIPDVPTFAEQGFAKFNTTAWMAILTPKRTPDSVLQRLGDATSESVRDPAFVEQLRSMGAEPLEANASETVARMKAELLMWRALSR
jgi:tripartite-type tricarboxylate transporter receptor subunit TctC